MTRHLLTKYGERCLVLRHGTRDGRPALVRSERSGDEFELYYEDIGRHVGGASAFYGLVGLESTSAASVGMTRKLREMRAAWKWREVSHVAGPRPGRLADSGAHPSPGAGPGVRNSIDGSGSTAEVLLSR